MTTLKDIAVACTQLPGGSESWAEELREELAKVYCKSRKDIPAWTKLTSVQRLLCLGRAEKMLTAMVNFFQTKLDAETK